MQLIDFKVDEKYHYLEMKLPTLVNGIRIPDIKLKVFQCLLKSVGYAFGSRYTFIDENKTIYKCQRTAGRRVMVDVMFTMDNLIEKRDTETSELKALYVPMSEIEESFKKMIEDSYLDLPQKEYMKKVLELIEGFKKEIGQQ